MKKERPYQALLYLIIIISILAVKCTKDGDGFRYFKVPAGHNNCRVGDMPPLLQSDATSLEISFKVTTNWLNLDNGVWNKIGGLSNGDHRKNSCRAVAKSDGVSIFLAMYVRNNGEKSWTIIDTIPPNGTYSVLILNCGDTWQMHYEGRIYEMAAQRKNTLMRNYACRPNISKVIDEDWFIWIKYDK